MVGLARTDPRSEAVGSTYCRYSDEEEHVLLAGASYWLTRDRRYSSPFPCSIRFELLTGNFHEGISYLLP